jgi:WD40 repeat protein/tRNA A-37 threonylcarbamoyl transferase component Bud32
MPTEHDPTNQPTLPHHPTPGDAATLSHCDQFQSPVDGATVSHAHSQANPATIDHIPPAHTQPGNEEGVPGYEILGELGRGGMGVVYKARDTRLNRTVALKMVLAGAHARPHDLVRFLAEAEAMAAVRHPNVIQVHGYGEHDGQPYMALEFCEGGTLGGHIKRHTRLTPAASAEMVEKVARGVQAAHDLGIVHRDLKPANVLLNAEGEPKVTDFGLAKRAGSGEMTQTNAVMGTPAYMAPEQAKGQTKFVGPAADVYALGVILFECLAGRKPFEAEDTILLIRKVVEDDPPPLASIIKGVPRDLELICRKCMAKEARERYPTAADLADDLRRFLSGEAVSVRPPGRVELVAKWVRRKPTLAAAYGLTAFSILALGLVAGAVWLWQRAEDARDKAEIAQQAAEHASTEADTQRDAANAAQAEAVIQRDTANAARAEAVKQRDIADSARQGEEAAKKQVERERENIARRDYGHTLQVAYQLWKDNKIAEARTVLAGTRHDLRGWEYDYVHRLCHADLLTLEHKSRLYGATFSPDGSNVLTFGQDEKLCVWDFATGKKLSEIQLKRSGTLCVGFSPDRSKVITGSNSKTAQTWDAATGKPLTRFVGHAGNIRCVAFSQDASRVVTASEDKTAWVWDTATGKPLAKLTGHDATVYAAAFSPDGSRVVTGSADHTARIWDVASSKVIIEYKEHAKVVYAVAFTPDGSKVVTAGDTTARVWDATTGNTIVELNGLTSAVYSVVFSPDGSKVLTGNIDGMARIWDITTGKIFAELKGHTAWAYSAAFSADGSKVVTAGYDMTARVWDATDTTYSALRGYLDKTKAIKLLDVRENKAVIGDFAMTVWVVDAATGERFAEFKGHMGTVFSAAFSTDGTKVVTTCADQVTRIWDIATEKPLVQLKGAPNQLVRVAAFSPDGSKLVTGGTDSTARVWDATTGGKLTELVGHSGFVSTVAFSRDGSRIVTGSSDKTARVWDVASGKMLCELQGHTGTVRYAAFSPDGSKIRTGSLDNTARIWDVATHATLTEFKGHTAQVVLVAFSPDGSRLLTAGEDSTIRIWDTQSGAELLTLPGHTFASFSRDGNGITTNGGPSLGIITYDRRPVNRAFIKPPAP